MSSVVEQLREQLLPDPHKEKTPESGAAAGGSFSKQVSAEEEDILFSKEFSMPQS